MNYYKDQLLGVEVGKTIYPPTIKVFSNGNGKDTNHMSLNPDSAKALIEWLHTHFIKNKTKNLKTKIPK